MHLIYILLAKWDEQRPRNRKCGLWGIVNRPGKLEPRLPRDMKTLDKKGVKRPLVGVCEPTLFWVW